MRDHYRRHAESPSRPHHRRGCEPRRRQHTSREAQLRVAGEPLIGGRHTFERTVTVTVPIQATYQLAAVGVPESDRNVLRGKLENVDHVPASEVPGRQIQAPLPPCRSPDRLPVVGPCRGGPLLSPDRREAELAFDGQGDKRLAIASAAREAVSTRIPVRYLRSAHSYWRHLRSLQRNQRVPDPLNVDRKRCALYTPGHRTHLIQAKLARDAEASTYRHGTVVSVQHHGWITVDVDGELLRFWNHDPAWVRGCFEESGGRVGLPGWNLLHARHARGRYCICVSAGGPTPCAPPSTASPDPSGLHQQTLTHGGFLIAGIEAVRHLHDDDATCSNGESRCARRANHLDRVGPHRRLTQMSARPSTSTHRS